MCRHYDKRGKNMSKDKFMALLILLVPATVELIVQKYKINEEDATTLFYTSKVYSLLEEEEAQFMIYCIEEYKKAKDMTGKNTIELFNKYGVLDYIIVRYGALHTTGGNYIVEDIDLFIGQETKFKE